MSKAFMRWRKVFWKVVCLHFWKEVVDALFFYLAPKEKYGYVLLDLGNNRLIVLYREIQQKTILAIILYQQTYTY